MSYCLFSLCCIFCVFSSVGLRLQSRNSELPISESTSRNSIFTTFVLDEDIDIHVPLALNSQIRGTPEYQTTMNDMLRKTKTEEKGFPHKPPRNQWGQIFREAIDRGRQNPCHAEILSGFGRNNYAYGSNVLLFLNTITLGLYYNKSIALCKSTYEQAFWRRYFDDANNLGVCTDAKLCNVGIADSRLGNELSRLLYRDDKKYLYSMKQFLYSNFFTFKPGVAQHMKQRLAEKGLRNGSPYIGMHVRHGDKAKEVKSIATERYVERALELMDRGKIIYLASDDGNALHTAREYVSRANRTISVVSNFDQYADSSYQKIKDQDYTGAQLKSIDILAEDIYALNHADAFVGTQKSNMGVATYYARQADENTTVFVDQSWGHWGWL